MTLQQKIKSRAEQCRTNLLLHLKGIEVAPSANLDLPTSLNQQLALSLMIDPSDISNF